MFQEYVIVPVPVLRQQILLALKLFYFGSEPYAGSPFALAQDDLLAGAVCCDDIKIGLSLFQRVVPPPRSERSRGKRQLILMCTLKNGQRPFPEICFNYGRTAQRARRDSADQHHRLAS